jgi:hypothetical protein
VASSQCRTANEYSGGSWIRSQKQKSVLDRRDLKIKNRQKKISALKRNANEEAEDDDGSDDDNADANAGAGNAFGGRVEKKQAKKRSKK